ncbi:uncharacterized protein C2845_PM16G05230 [Panicum miliaceum]|uniref:Uncharacterized protein n=1 Tax=Panicum miliaceum TaxID=4540 RepID=A0A3L6PT04_PANMI|nr:uncharacterized protein C2845_PM16G05230 [Panicum miliaceum]
MRVGNDPMKKSAAVTLRRKFNLATFNDGESVEDYALRLQGMAADQATLGAGAEDDKIVEKIVWSVPQRLKHIILAITTLLDVSTLTVSDLVGRLKAAEDTFEEAPGTLQHDRATLSHAAGVESPPKESGGGEPLREWHQRRLWASWRRKTRAQPWAWRPVIWWAVVR